MIKGIYYTVLSGLIAIAPLLNFTEIFDAYKLSSTHLEKMDDLSAEANPFTAGYIDYRVYKQETLLLIDNAYEKDLVVLVNNKGNDGNISILGTPLSGYKDSIDYEDLLPNTQSLELDNEYEEWKEFHGGLKDDWENREFLLGDYSYTRTDALSLNSALGKFRPKIDKDYSLIKDDTRYLVSTLMNPRDSKAIGIYLEEYNIEEEYSYLNIKAKLLGGIN